MISDHAWGLAASGESSHLNWPDAFAIVGVPLVIVLAIVLGTYLSRRK